ncbi:uncharacterized protein LOC128676534 [Plodia interpunctella]|uniref:uncharacterized protein LOC128676534 n=1 Tax=Plodia interpunctella TaxID=58824 RepID=UPI0023680A21|nr:uncharacterized protein LOC128676534 [Plodia interpunctella]
MSSRPPTKRRRSRKSSQPERLILMTPKTKDFIQKICYKKTASIDMTQYGFITESRMGPINVYVKPLRDQIQKILETSNTKEVKTMTSRRKSRLPSSPLSDPTYSKLNESKTDPSQPSIESLNKFMIAKLQKKSVVFSL